MLYWAEQVTNDGWMNASCGLLPVFLLTQEEKIEPNSGNGTFNSEPSWKIPTSSHILMRASQVSSEFEQGDQSYLRLSLGQFFGQRSEALGCLGSTDVDVVKRVSISVFLLEKLKKFFFFSWQERLQKL